MTPTSIRHRGARVLPASILILLTLWPVTFSAQRRSDSPDQASASARRFARHPRITPAQRQALESYAAATDIEFDDRDVPKFLMGTLSGRRHADPIAEARRALDEHGASFRRRREDGFLHRRHETDRLGETHVRMTQTYKGLPVIGAELIVHLRSDSVSGISGHFIADLNVPTEPAIAAAEASDIAVSFVQSHGAVDAVVVESRTPVVFLNAEGVGQLAIPVRVRYSSVEGVEVDDIFVNALDRSVLGRHSLVFRARHRQIYDANYSTYGLPGTLIFEEGGTSTDAAALGAYDGTGVTYDFYKTVFGRDSFDNQGSPIVSSVHVRDPYAWRPDIVAAWSEDLQQMVYGDGDGVVFGNMATSLDVTAHEVTHGVTQFSARLIYQSESGALNEATSDILAEAIAFSVGKGDWKLAADVYTPGVEGDALRYMYDPTRDELSADYYPERLYPEGSCAPAAGNDRCGVHRNSGIANLFFYLLSVGGSHPRQKTDVIVPGIGIEKAQQIWYRALTTYMVATTGFADARSATARAAADLYGGPCSPEWIAVQKGWDAVGVPGTWSCGCSLTLASQNQSMDAAGGAGTVTVTGSAGCSWTATSSVDFITITAGTSGAGNGSVSFDVAANPGSASRTGRIAIGDQTFIVSQAGAVACSVAISPATQSIAAAGGAGTFAVSAPPACGWTASANASFITVTSGASGSGSGTVAFNIAPNVDAAPRTGTITVLNQVFAVSQASSCASCAAKDFNGDGRPDIVWRNYATGANAVWLMHETQTIGSMSLPAQYDPYLVIDAVGDFNGDGKPDLLLRHYLTGVNTIWYFDGANRIGTAVLPGVFDTMWSIEGVGDFNGDHHLDIVWRHYLTGANALWYMNGATRMGTAALPAFTDVNDSIDAVADLNLDGHADLLVRNYQTGRNRVVFMNGTQQVGSGMLPSVTDTAWQIGGVGDFNADGAVDIVWRHQATGKNVLWYLAGTQVIASPGLPVVADPSWWIAGVAR
jgi:vibriolysin